MRLPTKQLLLARCKQSRYVLRMRLKRTGKLSHGENLVLNGLNDTLKEYDKRSEKYMKKLFEVNP